MHTVQELLLGLAIVSILYFSCVAILGIAIVISSLTLHFISLVYVCVLSCLITKDAQLSQRDRAAGYISFGRKWKTGTQRQYFTDIVSLASTTVT